MQTFSKQTNVQPNKVLITKRNKFSLYKPKLKFKEPLIASYDKESKLRADLLRIYKEVIQGKHDFSNLYYSEKWENVNKEKKPYISKSCKEIIQGYENSKFIITKSNVDPEIEKEWSSAQLPPTWSSKYLSVEHACTLLPGEIPALKSPEAIDNAWNFKEQTDRPLLTLKLPSISAANRNIMKLLYNESRQPDTNRENEAGGEANDDDNENEIFILYKKLQEKHKPIRIRSQKTRNFRSVHENATLLEKFQDCGSF